MDVMSPCGSRGGFPLTVDFGVVYSHTLSGLDVVRESESDDPETSATRSSDGQHAFVNSADPGWTTFSVKTENCTSIMGSGVGLGAERESAASVLQIRVGQQQCEWDLLSHHFAS